MDRHGAFEPQLVEKYCRRLPGFDAKVTQLFAHGMTTRRVRAMVKELYGVEVSAELISKVTDVVHEEFEEWQSRPLRETLCHRVSGCHTRVLGDTRSELETT